MVHRLEFKREHLIFVVMPRHHDFVSELTFELIQLLPCLRPVTPSILGPAGLAIILVAGVLGRQRQRGWLVQLIGGSFSD